jgi:two-component SAPR family response regulator
MTPPETSDTIAHALTLALFGPMQVWVQGQPLPDRHTLSLDITGAEVDVHAFDSAVLNGKRAELAQAVTLYRGPLLEGCLEEWVSDEREAREQSCLRALQTLGDSALTAGDFDAAAGCYQRAVQMDPLWDAARRGWMELC